MRPRTGFLSAALIVLVASMVLVAVPASAADGSLAVGVSQDDTGEATVTVTHNGTAVENATVQVTSTENYTGTGEYTTGTNGTVSLPEPNETVNVTVTATWNGSNATTTATLSPVNETENATENETNASDVPFGLRLTTYKSSLNVSENETRGLLVSDWVRENNPGNVPDHAGPDGNETAANGNGNGNGESPGAEGKNGKDNGKGPGDDRGNGKNGGEDGSNGNGKARGHEKGGK